MEARLGCHFLNVGDIDNARQEFRAEIWLGVFWEEPRIKGKPTQVHANAVKSINSRVTKRSCYGFLIILKLP